jgi:tRNA pseudouridine synthase 9
MQDAVCHLYAPHYISVAFLHTKYNAGVEMTDSPIAIQAAVKARWVGRSLADVFNTLFPFQPAGYYEREIERGRLFATDRHGAVLGLRSRGVCRVLLKLGDTVSHITHTHEPSVREPALQLLGETEDVVAVCKAASVPVHACGRFRRNTVVHILAECHGLADLRTVHRLDRVTSGVVLLAKTRASAHRLSRQVSPLTTASPH